MGGCAYKRGFQNAMCAFVFFTFQRVEPVKSYEISDFWRNFSAANYRSRQVCHLRLGFQVVLIYTLPVTKFLTLNILWCLSV
jgi:hypothetical protein